MSSDTITRRHNTCRYMIKQKGPNLLLSEITIHVRLTTRCHIVILWWDIYWYRKRVNKLWKISYWTFLSMQMSCELRFETRLLYVNLTEFVIENKEQILFWISKTCKEPYCYMNMYFTSGDIRWKRIKILWGYNLNGLRLIAVFLLLKVDKT